MPLMNGLDTTEAILKALDNGGFLLLGAALIILMRRWRNARKLE
jgi:hypothetical protein